MKVSKQQRNSLITNGWFTNYQRNKEIAYTPKGVSLNINLMVYRHNGVLPVTVSIGLNIYICDLTINNFSGLAVEYLWVYTHSGSPKTS